MLRTISFYRVLILHANLMKQVRDQNEKRPCYEIHCFELPCLEGLEQRQLARPTSTPFERDVLVTPAPD